MVLTARQHFLAVTDEDGLVRILEIPKTFSVCSRNEVRHTEHHLITAETKLIQSRFNYLEQTACTELTVHLSEVKQVLLKLLSVSLYTEHQRDEVL